MKRFHQEILLFIAIFVLFFHLYPEYLFQTKKYIALINTEIFSAVDKSETIQGQHIKKLYLGDSVDEQILSTRKLPANHLHLATNQAISLVGQYVLLSNLIANSNTIDTLELRLIPFSFANNLDNHLTYNNFIKPFYKASNKRYFTKEVIQQIEHIPFYYLAQYHPVLTSLWSPNISDPLLTYEISPINEVYLAKIDELCRTQKIYLIFRPAPINELNRNTMEHVKNVLIKKNPRLFKPYFEQLKIEKSYKFIEDRIHFKPEFLRKDLY